MLWSVRLSKRFRDGLLAILGVAALSLAAFFALHEPLRRPVRLRMTAGQEGGTRHRIAQALQREAGHRGEPVPGQAARPDRLAPPLWAVPETPSSLVNRRNSLTCRVQR